MKARRRHSLAKFTPGSTVCKTHILVALVEVVLSVPLLTSLCCSALHDSAWFTPTKLAGFDHRSRCSRCFAHLTMSSVKTGSHLPHDEQTFPEHKASLRKYSASVSL